MEIKYYYIITKDNLNVPVSAYQFKSLIDNHGWVNDGVVTHNSNQKRLVYKSSGTTVGYIDIETEGDV